MTTAHEALATVSSHIATFRLPSLGNRYTLNVRLIESGVRLDGLLWARTNLIYSSQADRYVSDRIMNILSQIKKHRILELDGSNTNRLFIGQY
jgi:hypothetical protein